MVTEHDAIVVLDEGVETLANLSTCCKAGPARAVTG